MFERIFRLSERGTSPGREVVAGLTTFTSMAYILVVNPDMLAKTGMDQGALVTATALASAAGCILMALLTNYPIALAPGMGMNAFFTYSICLGMDVPWQGALAMVFWNGILFVILSLTGIRSLVVRAIPECLKTGIQTGIGLFIALIGLQNAGIIVDHPVTLLQLGALSDRMMPNAATLAIAGLLVAVVLMVKRVPGAILIAMATVAVAGLAVPAGEGKVTPMPEQLMAWPQSLDPLLLQVDWLYPLRHWQSAWVVVLSLLFVDLFDSIGTLIAVSRQAKLTDGKGDLPDMRGALLADAAATTVGACVGCSPVTAYIESATGIEAGGRTGLTALVVALCFLAALAFHPLILAIPGAATAPALILVGILMLSGLQHLKWHDLTEVLPCAVATILIPLSFGIANGIALGCIAFTAISICTGKWRQVHWLMAALSALFVLKFTLAGA